MRVSRHANQLPGPEVLVASVIMQGQHTGEFSGCPHRLHEYRLSGRTIGQLPRHVLEREAVELHRMLHDGLWDAAGIGLEQGRQVLRPSLPLPFAEVRPTRAAERQSRRILRQP